MLDIICNELGVEIGEEWLGYGATTSPRMFKIEGNILWENYKDGWYEAVMADYVALIKGELKPVWKPKKGQRYYTPDLVPNPDVRFSSYIWQGEEWDEWMYDNNLTFKTKEEAIGCALEMIELARGGI